MRKFLDRVYRFNPRLFLSLLLVSLSVSLFEGSSIVAILPLLALTGLFTMTPSSHPLVSFLHHCGINHLELNVVLLLFIGLVVITAILQRSLAIISSVFQQKFNTRLNADLYRQLAFVPWSFWLKRKTSDINHIVNNEIGRVSLGCYFFFQLITALSMLIMYLLISLWIAPLLTLIIVVGGGAVFLFLSSLVKRSRRAGLIISDYSKKSFFALSEHLSSLKITKAYGLEEGELQRLLALRQEVEHGYLKFVRAQSFQDLIYKLVAAIFISGIFYIAIKYLHLPLVSLILVVVVFSRLWPRISTIQNSLHSISISIPAFNNIINLEREVYIVMQTSNAINTLASTELMTIDSIECVNVSYYYPDSKEPTIVNLSMKIRRGEMIGCVGVSGSGKSTLADLLLGLVTPQQGNILVNQQPLSQVYSQYQNLIGYVTQEVFLFNGSIRQNLQWSNSQVTDNDMWQMLELVQLHSFVTNLAQQLDSPVGERGTNLSGGERQRLLLARTLLRKPQFLILDEATSALDEDNEQRIEKILQGLKGQLTIFVITHRPVLLANVDRVFTFNNGCLIG